MRHDLLIATVLLAACSILYELIAAHALSLLAASTVVWYSVTIGLYLVGMGLGSLFISRRMNGSAAQRLVAVELVLSLIGVLIVPAIHCGHILFTYFDFKQSLMMGSVCFFSIAGVSTILVGLLTGMELPLIREVLTGYLVLTTLVH